MAHQTRKHFLTTATAAGAGLLLPAGLHASPAKKMLLHHVFFWLKNPGSQKDLDDLVAGLQTLRNIKTVKAMHIGVPATTEARSVVDNSYAVSELLFFKDLAGQQAYQDDPVHQKFVADCSHLWAKVVVYDAVDL